MIEKINISKIVSDHIHTLKNYGTDKPALFDYFLFFVLPLIIGVILLNFRILLSDHIINVLVTSLSVFAALLFNLLLLIYDIIRKPDETKKNENIKRQFLKQIYANISFCILIAITTVILLLISSLNDNNQQVELIYQQPNLFTIFLTFCVYYFVSIFILTLLMILKRVHVLLSKEFEN